MSRTHAAAASRIAVAGGSTAATFGLVTVMTLSSSPPAPEAPLQFAAAPAPPAPAEPVSSPQPPAREIVVIRRHRIVIPAGQAVAVTPSESRPTQVAPAASPAPRVTTTTAVAAPPVTAAPRPAPRPQPKPVAKSRAS